MCICQLLCVTYIFPPTTTGTDPCHVPPAGPLNSDRLPASMKTSSRVGLYLEWCEDQIKHEMTI